MALAADPRSAEHDIELILQIGLAINGEGDVDRLLRLTVDGIRQSLDYPYCAILLKEGHDLVIRAVTDFPDSLIGRRIPLGEGITGRCAVSRQEALVPDVEECPYYLHFGAGTFRSELDIPILFRGKLLGVLNTQSTQVAAFGERDARILRILATQIGVALHHAQVQAQLGLVQDIGIQLAAIVRTEALFPWIVEQVRSRLGYDTCAILAVAGEHLVLEAATGAFSGDLRGMRIPIGAGITGRCAAEKRPINVGDVRHDPGYISSGVPDARSEIALPCLFEGNLYAVLTVESSAEQAFDDDDVRLLSAVSAQVAVGLHQARTLAEADRMAVTDGLTGLHNYRYFYDRLQREMARSERLRHPLALVMVDLDHFKDVNDRFGHLKGDEVLRVVAETITRNIREYDEATSVRQTDDAVASRYGGEEFIIIMPYTSASGAAVAAERLRAAIETRVARQAGLVQPGGAPIRVTASVGVAAYRVGMNVEDFVRLVDGAAYQAKSQGRNQVVVLG